VNIAAQQGIDDQGDYWQGNDDWWDLPTASETANAGSRSTIEVSQAEQAAKLPVSRGGRVVGTLSDCSGRSGGLDARLRRRRGRILVHDHGVGDLDDLVDRKVGRAAVPANRLWTGCLVDADGADRPVSSSST
jgi:hypothetical protein